MAEGVLPAQRTRLRHRFALDLASLACRLPAQPIAQPVEAMGLQFQTPVGIAAGFDRLGRLGRRASTLGFGFTEIGSLTAADLPLLAAPRLGAAQLGVNLTLDAGHAIAQTCALLQGAWPWADYLLLNLIGPACAPLLEQPGRLQARLASLRDHHRHLNCAYGRQVPLVAKLRCLPGDLPLALVDRLLGLGFDGLLLAHDPGPPATRQRYLAWQDERVQAQACAQVAQLHRLCGPNAVLMSVGGIQTADHLRERRAAGAQLVQVHAALLQQGPWLARRLLGAGTEGPVR